MKINAKLLRVRASKRDYYERIGITVIFGTQFGDITRTFNLPSSYNPRSAIFTFLESSMEENLPLGLLDRPKLFSLTVEEKLRNRDFELCVEESGNMRHPYNIVSITPILTSNSSSLTASEQ